MINQNQLLLVVAVILAAQHSMLVATQVDVDQTSEQSKQYSQDLTLLSKSRFEARNLGLPINLECQVFIRRVSKLIEERQLIKFSLEDSQDNWTQLAHLIEKPLAWPKVASVPPRGRSLLAYVNQCRLLDQSGGLKQLDELKNQIKSLQESLEKANERNSLLQRDLDNCKTKTDVASRRPRKRHDNFKDLDMYTIVMTDGWKNKN